MLSKLSRFLTIATLTTLTCIITHPSYAKTVDSQIKTIDALANLTPNELIDQVNWQGDNFLGKSAINNTANFSFDAKSVPQGSGRQDGLMIYAIVADCFKQLGGGQEANSETTNLTNPFNTFL